MPPSRVRRASMYISEDGTVTGHFQAFTIIFNLLHFFLASLSDAYTTGHAIHAAQLNRADICLIFELAPRSYAL